MKVKGPGRPLLGAERRVRYQVILEPKVAEKLRRYGKDNLSAGIAKAAERTRGKKVNAVAKLKASEALAIQATRDEVVIHLIAGNRASAEAISELLRDADYRVEVKAWNPATGSAFDTDL